MGEKKNDRVMDSGRVRSEFVFVATLVVLAALLVLTVLVTVTIGSMDISVPDVYSVIGWELFHPEALAGFAKGSIHNVVWLVRLPRVILGLGVGMALAVCGVVMQAIVKNPLADPYVLGISSGATLGATVALGLGLGRLLGTQAVGMSAFAGTLAVSFLVMFISGVGGPANSVKLVLSGMAIGMLCSAVSNFVIYLINDKNVTQDITFWSLGSLTNNHWEVVVTVLVVAVVGVAFFWTQHRPLNLMLLGDDVSITLGTNLNVYRIVYLVINSFMVAICVYAAGTIGFIGLVIPHIVRMVFGTDHRKLIPLSALLGAIFIIWADVLARMIIPGSEMPIGILISLVGAPVFIYMMVRRTYGFGGGAQ